MDATTTNDNKHNILFICTSSLPGLWLDELATPYYIFKGVGYHIDICCINNAIQVDEASLNHNMTKEAAAFINDHDAQCIYKDPYSLDNIVNNNSLLSKYGCVYLTGGHGCLRDYINNDSLTRLLEYVYNNNKGCIGAICHGLIGLLNVKEQNGKYLLKDKFVSGFTNEEENSLGLLSKLPLTVEDSLDERGALLVKAAPWNPKACVDSRLASGQNPQSSVEVAERVLDILRSLGNTFSPPGNVNKPWGK